ncbi:TonB-dependent receptor [Xanthocytophaga agilis]|uniref:TonB-dependent receptor n=1 Tax=Xanthocytophaga agilis TaxID=3048010 RepID=A0AAE3R9Q9_9BACT|nr:TonB-dependent receptor [Xanthocytophaga agilis]MDJ1506516.1 TonB-dependent receptor [Xanthocytophaga agilis]
MQTKRQLPKIVWKIMKISALQISIVLLFGGIALANHSYSYAQADLSKKVTLQFDNQQLHVVLSQIEKMTNIKFSYIPQAILPERKVSVHADNKAVEDILQTILQPLNINYEVVGSQVVLSKRIADDSSNGKMDANTSTSVNAYAITITGTVTDENGNGLPGVSVSLKGTTTGTSTDKDGKYSLAIPSENGTLVFSFIGYTTEEIAINNRNVVDIKLVPDIKALSEVVVVGYGTQRRVEVTSAVQTVKAENFVKGPVLDAGQLLQGKVAGLSITAPSGDPTSGSQILLRGNTTLLGANSNPLVIIDGIPGDLKTVSPEDIESIDVLKDGSAAAIYGTRGTNGVILVTTRRAGANFTNSVEYSGYVSTQTIARKLNMLTAADYRSQITSGQRDASWDLGSSTDWLKESTQTPISHVHNITFRGGNNTTNYLANVNYRSLQGIFKKSNNETFTGRIDINHSMFNDKVKLNMGILNANNKYTTTGDGFSFSGYTYRQTLIQNPTAPVKDSTGHWFEQPSLFNYENPLGRIYESDGENSSQNTRLNASLTFNPIKDLKLSALVSYTKFNENRGYAETKNHISTLRDGKNGYASVGASSNVSKLMELTAQYSKEINNHKFTILGGYSYQDNMYTNFWMQNWDFPTDRFSYNNIGIGNALKTGLAPEFSTKTLTNLIGFFGRLTYNYNEKYLLMVSLRHEAASQLYGTKQPWGNFPAVSAGWRISSEPFMRNQNVIDELKLRAGYGVTGTQPSDLFLGVAILSYGNYVYSDGKWIQTLGPSQNPNPNLRWEEKHESNIGIDYSLLKGKISGSVDYYIRRINGLLYDFQVPSPPNLYPSTRANVGIMENKGLEVMLNITPVQTQDFQWTTSFNFSTNTNKLVSLSNDIYKTTNNYFTTGSTGEPIQTFTNIVTVGKNIGDFYGFKVVDISEDGKWIYEGRDGKPVAYDDFQHAFEDKKVLGNGLPKFYAGWNNNFRYKNFDLSVTMRGAFKYQILNFQRMYYENTGLQQYNRLKSAYDKVYGKAVLSTSMPLEFNSHYVENGDFWKIDNIILGYNIRNLNNKYIHSARVYVSTLNTFIITGYKGIDPEVNRLGLNPGNDERDKYPTTRTFTVGVNLNF